jgi:hypothetical protein
MTRKNIRYKAEHRLDRTFKASQTIRPGQSIQVILHTQHGWGVNGFSLEKTAVYLLKIEGFRWSI